MPHCNRCGEDHAEMMNNDLVRLLGNYDDQIEAVVDKIMSDETLGVDHSKRRETRVTFINTIAAKMVARAALLDLESKEEKLPQLQHGEQLSLAFSMTHSDLLERLTGMFGHILLSGEVPDLVKAKRDIDEADAKASATVH